MHLISKTFYCVGFHRCLFIVKKHKNYQIVYVKILKAKNSKLYHFAFPFLNIL